MLKPLHKEDTLFYSNWFRSVFKLIPLENINYIKDLTDTGAKKIVLFSAPEMMFIDQVDKYGQQIYSELMQYLRDHEISTHMIVNMPSEEYTLLSDHFTYHSWPTYFVNYTYSMLIRNKFLATSHAADIKKLFICKNNRARSHRARLLDQLFNNNLFEHGHISWHHTNPQILDYKFKFWKNETLTLDQEFTKKDQQPIMQFFQSDLDKCSLIDLVTESTVDHKFITEKTYVPIFYKKPFLILGCKGIHHILKNQGFELYDEIFDYSFDLEDSLDRRIQGIVDNLDRLKNKSYNTLRSVIQKKLEYNQHHAVSMANDKSLIPSIMFEETGFEDYADKNIDLNFHQYFSLNICRYSK